MSSSSVTKASSHRLRPIPDAPKLRALQSELNQRKIDLINIELDVSGTFALIAREASGDPQKRSRNRRYARQGYDTVIHFMRSTSMGERQRREIQQRLNQLKNTLADLGEFVR